MLAPAQRRIRAPALRLLSQLQRQGGPSPRRFFFSSDPEEPPTLMLGSAITMGQLRNNWQARNKYLNDTFRDDTRFVGQPMPDLPDGSKSNWQANLPYVNSEIIRNKLLQKPLQKPDSHIKIDKVLLTATTVRWGVFFMLARTPEGSWMFRNFLNAEDTDFEPLELEHVVLEHGPVKDVATQGRSIYLLMESGHVMELTGLDPRSPASHPIFSFERIPGWEGIQSFGAAHGRLVGVDSKGQVWRQGMTGDPRLEAAKDKPVLEEGVENAAHVFSGNLNYSGVLTREQKLYLWGTNQLNRCLAQPGKQGDLYVPYPQEAFWNGLDLGIDSVSMGDEHMLAVTTEGQLWASSYYPYRMLIRRNGTLIDGELLEKTFGGAHLHPAVDRREMVKLYRRLHADHEVIMSENPDPHFLSKGVPEHWESLDDEDQADPMLRMERFGGAAVGAAWNLAWTRDGRRAYTWGYRPDLGVTTMLPTQWDLKKLAGTRRPVRVKRVVAAPHGAVVQLQWAENEPEPEPIVLRVKPNDDSEEGEERELTPEEEARHDELMRQIIEHKLPTPPPSLSRKFYHPRHRKSKALWDDLIQEVIEVYKEERMKQGRPYVETADLEDQEEKEAPPKSENDQAKDEKEKAEPKKE